MFLKCLKRNFGVFACISALISLDLALMQSIKMSRCFGMGNGFGLVLFFFGPIGRLILGFGSAEYIGPQYSGKRQEFNGHAIP